VTFHPDKLDEPLHYRKPRLIFVCSMGDLFHEEVKEEWLVAVFGAMFLAPQHTYLLLTKRPQWAQELLLNARSWRNDPPQNIWLGVTAENQEQADMRIPILLDIPAAGRFVSIEPMLGPVDLSDWIGRSRECGPDHQFSDRFGYRGRLHWVIAGGESGPGARPSHPDWARSLRDQCQVAGVPYFFKAWGEWAPIGLLYTPYRSVYLADDGQVVAPAEYAKGEAANRRPWRLARVGKKRAGHLLDGQEWREFPA
jgi:protein gp37